MISPPVCGYHAHVCLSQASLSQAKALCQAAAQQFELVPGRVHEKAVGPHSDWSCQLASSPSLFGNWCHGWQCIAPV
jgi:DOPA 4,5-dioxygenase